VTSFCGMGVTRNLDGRHLPRGRGSRLGPWLAGSSPWAG
jgi:hypothetical protein